MDILDTIRLDVDHLKGNRHYIAKIAERELRIPDSDDNKELESMLAKSREFATFSTDKLAQNILQISGHFNVFLDSQDAELEDMARRMKSVTTVGACVLRWCACCNLWQ